MSLSRWQRKYVIGGVALLPLAPFLYVQGQVARWKVGVLPGASGETNGIAGNGAQGLHARKWQSCLAGMSLD